jgi:hypothetical protein
VPVIQDQHPFTITQYEILSLEISSLEVICSTKMSR